MGEERWLTPGEAAALIVADETGKLGIGKSTVHTLFDGGYLRGYRTTGNQRRIEASSVAELNAVRRLPQRSDEQRGMYYAALAALRRHNRGEPDPMPRG